jgi:CheY-like chemotaxis protein
MRIFLIEDSLAEARLTREAFAETGIPHELRHVTDGRQATEFLFSEAVSSAEWAPDLILLDLNLPGKDGREVLREIKGNPEISRIPVIVVTNSEDPFDVDRVYRLNGNCYLTKPPDVDDFFSMIRSMVEFWRQTARLPRMN